MRKETIVLGAGHPFSWRLRPLFSLLAFLFTGMAVMASGPATNGSAAQIPASNSTGACEWAIIPSINTHVYNVFHGIAPISPNNVWAVGSRGDGNFGQLTLIEHWDGNAWSLVPSPDPGNNANEIEDVAAIASNDIWAAGYYTEPSGNNSLTMLLHWDGTTWSRVDSPNPGTFRNELYDIVAVSSTDIWAVGYIWPSGTAHRTLILHWDGVAWSVVSSPNVNEFHNYLTSVSTIASNDVWAVGQYQEASGRWQTLTMHWNGVAWSVVSSPNVPDMHNYIDSVSALTASDIWAVGFSCANNCAGFGGEHLLAMHWNGSAWSIVPTPSLGADFAYLKNVVAVAPNDAWAVGMYSKGSDALTLILHWDGSAWSQVSSPSPDPHSCCPVLEAIAALPNGELWIAGHHHFPGNPVFRTLIEHLPAPCGPATSTPTPQLSTATSTATSPVAPTNTASPTSVATAPPATGTQPAATTTAITTATDTATPTNTATAPVPPQTATACSIQFSDVPDGSTFYAFVRCLACRGVISGYEDGTFRPGNSVTRGQLSKIVSNAAGWFDQPAGQSFGDVPSDHTFYLFIERMASRGVISGYPCGASWEPCDSENRPYFRPYNQATRSQLSKIVANAAELQDPVPPGTQTYSDVLPNNVLWVYIERLSALGVMGGYECGGPGEPCDSESRPYFRPFTEVTRGQTAKIVSNTFFPGCQTPLR